MEGSQGHSGRGPGLSLLCGMQQGRDKEKMEASVELN